jgi:hypothetical protein
VLIAWGIFQYFGRVEEVPVYIKNAGNDLAAATRNATARVVPAEVVVPAAAVPATAVIAGRGIGSRRNY